MESNRFAAPSRRERRLRVANVVVECRRRMVGGWSVGRTERRGKNIASLGFARFQIGKSNLGKCLSFFVRSIDDRCRMVPFSLLLIETTSVVRRFHVPPSMDFTDQIQPDPNPI